MPNPGITAYGEACVKTALLLNVQDLRIDVGYGTIQKGDLPGLRLGWLASRDAARMARVAQPKDYTTICPAVPSEVLGLQRGWAPAHQLGPSETDQR